MVIMIHITLFLKKNSGKNFYRRQITLTAGTGGIKTVNTFFKKNVAENIFTAGK